jgi:hypothetical protein
MPHVLALHPGEWVTSTSTGPGSGSTLGTHPVYLDLPATAADERGDRARADRQVAVVPAAMLRTPATDDLEKPEPERPTRLLGQVNASVGTDQIDAPEPRPHRT